MNIILMNSKNQRISRQICLRFFTLAKHLQNAFIVRYYIYIYAMTDINTIIIGVETVNSFVVHFCKCCKMCHVKLL